MTDNDTREAPEQRGDDESAKAPPPPEQQHGGGTQSKRDQKQDEDIRNLQGHETALFWIAVLGMFIAAASVAVSTMQWSVMRHQLSDARAAAAEQQKTTERALAIAESQAAAAHAAAIGSLAQSWQAMRFANAADVSADAAKVSANNSGKSITTAIQSKRDDLRAWLSMSNMSTHVEAGKPWIVVVNFTNSGRTPARRIEGKTIAEAIPTGFGLAPRQYDMPSDIGFRGGFLPPNATLHTTVSVSVSKSTGRPAPLTQDIVDAINGGIVHLYAHGRLTYADVFGGRHWMTYCYMYTAEDGQWNACGEHNDTGDE